MRFIKLYSERSPAEYKIFHYVKYLSRGTFNILSHFLVLYINEHARLRLTHHQKTRLFAVLMIQLRRVT